MRKWLDRLYQTSGYIAACSLIAILVIIVLQMAARWFSIPFPGSSEYAGYLMAASSFLAFAYALNSGSHIRVNLLLKSLGQRRFYAELWCMAVGTAIAVYIAWFSVRMISWSLKFGDTSQGQDATPLWIVQLPVAIGAIILAICFLDNLLALIFKGRDNIKSEIVEHIGT